MKKTLLTLTCLTFSFALMAGGIVTNQNQSAMYTRLQARDATIGIDAVYFNPAGLTLLPNDGLYISINNQTVGQSRTINSDYTYLNEKEYKGTVFAPVFPGIYAAYKMNKLAFSIGFNPIGGGGGGTYDKGLPSFEYLVSDLVPGLQAQGQQINGYSADIYFEGKVAYFGYQANVTYQINDMISVAIGGRYVMGKEEYNGYLKNVQVDSAGKWMRADYLFSALAGKATRGAALASGAATNLNNAINAGLINGDDALADPTAIGTLTYLNLYTPGMTNTQAAQTFQGFAAVATTSAESANERASLLADQEVEYEKTASGFTPIISVNIKPSEKMNIALKYEGRTKLEFKNKTNKDFVKDLDSNLIPSVTLFPDGKKARYDIPAQLTAGITYRPIEKLFISAGFHYYFDKQANWEGKEDSLKNNLTEYALGLEYNLTEKLLISAGWLKTQSGAQSGGFNTDLSFSMNSNTFGGGFAYQVLPYLEVNLGGSYTMYEEGNKPFIHLLGDIGPAFPVKETYDKDVWIVAIGLNFNLAAMKK